MSGADIARRSRSRSRSRQQHCAAPKGIHPRIVSVATHRQNSRTPGALFLYAGSSFTTGAPSHSPGAYGDNCDGIGRTRLAQQPATGIGIGRGSERPVLQAVASGQSHWRNAMRLKHSLCFVYLDRFDSRKDCDSSDIGDASRQMHDGSDMSSGTSRNVRGRLICLHDGHTSSLFTPQ